MENEAMVNEVEILQNEADTGEELVEVGTTVDYTELLQQILAEQEEQTELLMDFKEQELSLLQEIKQGYDVVTEGLESIGINLDVVLIFIVLGFCWSCMRQWRKNVLSMGK